MKKWIALIFLFLGIDQVSKLLVVESFDYVGDTFPIIQDFFHFTYVRNSGAVFGLGSDSGISYLVGVAFAIIASGIFGYMLFKNDFTDKRKVLYALSLSLLIAGALGNGIDRMFQFDHSVVDFIDFRGIWQYVFNFADMCLNVGIAMFIFDQFILEPKRVKNNATE